MNVSLRLRPATVDDLDAIWAIESAVFEADAWSLELMREELTAAHRVYLALVDDHDVVRGYGGMMVMGQDGDVQTIAVDPTARGGGHGRALMDALLDEAADRGANQTFLEVRADNPVAQALYVSLGFEQIDVRAGYYQPGNIDALVMRLRMADRVGRRAADDSGRGTKPELSESDLSEPDSSEHDARHDQAKGIADEQL